MDLLPPRKNRPLLVIEPLNMKIVDDSAVTNDLKRSKRRMAEYPPSAIRALVAVFQRQMTESRLGFNVWSWSHYGRNKDGL